MRFSLNIQLGGNTIFLNRIVFLLLMNLFVIFVDGDFALMCSMKTN